jgi:hypothetical protein
MSPLYILFAPAFLYVVLKRINTLRTSIKNKNRDQIKVNLLFLFAIILMGAFMVYMIAPR